MFINGLLQKIYPKYMSALCALQVNSVNTAVFSVYIQISFIFSVNYFQQGVTGFHQPHTVTFSGEVVRSSVHGNIIP